MRNLEAFIGAFAALCLSHLLIGAAMFGGFNEVPPGLWFFVFNAILAAVAALVILPMEQHSWGWTHYAVAGAATTGIVIAVLLCVLFALVQAHSMQPQSSLWCLMFAAIGLTSGAMTGIGYRLFGGKCKQ